MPRLQFDQDGERVYENGVSECVMYAKDAAGAYPLGVPWNGMINVTKSPTGGEATALYADNMIYANLISAERLEGSLEAYTYPDEFEACDGSAEIGGVGSGVIIGEQTRKPFGLCYKTKIGNDADAEAGYKLHLIYNMLAKPTERAYGTVNESPEAITFNWDFTTTPVAVTGHKPTASIVIDSTKVDGAKLTQIEDLLYGEAADAELPLPDAIIAILEAV